MVAEGKAKESPTHGKAQHSEESQGTISLDGRTRLVVLDHTDALNGIWLELVPPVKSVGNIMYVLSRVSRMNTNDFCTCGGVKLFRAGRPNENLRRREDAR